MLESRTPPSGEIVGFAHARTRTWKIRFPRRAPTPPTSDTNLKAELYICTESKRYNVYIYIHHTSGFGDGGVKSNEVPEVSDVSRSWTRARPPPSIEIP